MNFRGIASNNVRVVERLGVSVVAAASVLIPRYGYRCITVLLTYPLKKEKRMMRRVQAQDLFLRIGKSRVCSTHSSPSCSRSLGCHIARSKHERNNKQARHFAHKILQQVYRPVKVAAVHPRYGQIYLRFHSLVEDSHRELAAQKPSASLLEHDMF